MKSVIGYVCLFMVFIVICTYCGGLFGIAAGGTFTESVAGFGNSMNQIKTGLIDPLNDFLAFFGLSSTYGGDALVYRLEDGEQDLQLSPLIPDQAYFAAFVTYYKASDKVYKANVLNPFCVFFDLDGNPISCIMFNSKKVQDMIKPGEVFADQFHQLISLDCSRSYYNSFSKFLYFDVDVTWCFVESDESRVINCYFNSSLMEYKYAGNFADLNKMLSKVK